MITMIEELFLKELKDRINFNSNYIPCENAFSIFDNKSMYGIRININKMAKFKIFYGGMFDSYAATIFEYSGIQNLDKNDNIDIHQLIKVLYEVNQIELDAVKMVDEVERLLNLFKLLPSKEHHSQINEENKKFNIDDYLFHLTEKYQNINVGYDYFNNNQCIIEFSDICGRSINLGYDFEYQHIYDEMLSVLNLHKIKTKTLKTVSSNFVLLNLEEMSEQWLDDGLYNKVYARFK